MDTTSKLSARRLQRRAARVAPIGGALVAALGLGLVVAYVA